MKIETLTFNRSIVTADPPPMPSPDANPVPGPKGSGSGSRRNLL